MTLHLILEGANRARGLANHAKCRLDPSPAYDRAWDCAINTAGRRAMYAVQEIIIYVKDALR
jgi:hypothetical protein